MATIDQQFVEYIVKTLVNNPYKVEVDRKIDEKGVLLSLTVDPEDVGRVIGKRGVTAQSIRMLLRALGTKQDARYNLKIVNTDEEEGEITIYGAPTSFGDIQKYLEENGFEITTAEFTRIPTDLKEVTPEQRETIDKMIEKLEEFDDVQNVYTNMKPE